jgi:hypothetical protein
MKSATTTNNSLSSKYSLAKLGKKRRRSRRALKLGTNLALIALGMGFAVDKSAAYNFHFGARETAIYHTDFDTSTGWALTGTVITEGAIKGISAWGSASYSIAPVSLDKGDINLYWSGIYPIGATTESDKYYVGLQYFDNSPVCYNSQANVIVETPPPCSGDSVTQVDENAELKVALRPKDKTNVGNTWDQLYIDPNFDPVNNYSPASTRLNIATYQETVPVDYRLKVRKKSPTTYKATLSSWNGSAWVNLTAKPGYTSPLSILDANWINAVQEIEKPVTFESINLQFRQATASRQTAITALALTQGQPFLTSRSAALATMPVGTPEPNLAIISLTLGLGMLLNKVFDRNLESI